MKHIRVTAANLEPVFFSYPADPGIDNRVRDHVHEHAPEYDFVAEDGVGHHFWTIRNRRTITELVERFATLPAT